MSESTIGYASGTITDPSTPPLSRIGYASSLIRNPHRPIGVLTDTGWDWTKRLTLTGDGWDGAGSFKTYRWSDSNLPWAYSSATDWETNLPEGVTVADLQTGASTFYENLKNTVDAAGERVIVRLPAGDHVIDSFRMIGSSGSPTYSFGFWFPNLSGFTGVGPDKTFITLAADCPTLDVDGVTDRTADAHAEMAAMVKADFAPLLRGFCRLDGTGQNVVYLGGVTFRAADQLPLTAVGADLDGVYVPQPSPHSGVVTYSGSNVIVSHVRFQAAGRAMLSQPPFECPNFSTQRSNTTIYHSEFDGRRSPDLDPAQPRRCVSIMLNNETSHLLEDSWLHHSNLSRYAANDQNGDTAGQYTIRRVLADHISDNLNTDPAINNGNSLGGTSPVTPFGWESSNATITVEDVIVHQRIGYVQNGQAPAHFQMTTVGSRNPQGGRFHMTNVEHHYEGYPDIDDYLVIRVGLNTYWMSDGLETTQEVYGAGGNRLTGYVYTDTWPPTKAALEAAGVFPDTHYVVKLA